MKNKVGEPLLFIVQPKLNRSNIKIQEKYVIQNLSPQQDLTKNYIQEVVGEVMKDNRKYRKNKKSRKR